MTNKKTEGATSAKVAPSTHGTSQVDNNTKNKRASTGGRGRHRNFATVLYPESAAENWVQILDETHIAALLSPLHDRDINPTGEPKKPHWHLLFLFDGVKTKEQVEAIIHKLGGVGCEVVANIRGYARYLIHADNPEKAQYSAADVRAFAGADFDSITHLPTDDIRMIQEMCAFIRVNQIRSFARFADICAESHPDWYRALVTRCSYFIKEYIKSSTWEDYGGVDICHAEQAKGGEENE